MRFILHSLESTLFRQGDGWRKEVLQGRMSVLTHTEQVETRAASLMQIAGRRQHTLGEFGDEVGWMF